MASSGSEYDLAVAAESLELSSDSSGPQELVRVKLTAPINSPAVPEHVGGAGTPGRSPGPLPVPTPAITARSTSDSSKLVKARG